MQTILEPQSLASTSLQELMREMLIRLGEDPERDGLRDVEVRKSPTYGPRIVENRFFPSKLPRHRNGVEMASSRAFGEGGKSRNPTAKKPPFLREA